MYEGVGDEPVDIQTGKFGKIFMLRRISTATSIYSNLKSTVTSMVMYLSTNHVLAPKDAVLDI